MVFAAYFALTGDVNQYPTPYKPFSIA